MYQVQSQTFSRQDLKLIFASFYEMSKTFLFAENDPEPGSKAAPREGGRGRAKTRRTNSLQRRPEVNILVSIIDVIQKLLMSIFLVLGVIGKDN